MNYTFVVDGKIVKWKYVHGFFERDSNMYLCLAPKLSAKHIFCNTFEKMCVCLAA